MRLIKTIMALKSTRNISAVISSTLIIFVRCHIDETNGYLPSTPKGRTTAE